MRHLIVLMLFTGVVAMTDTAGVTLDTGDIVVRVGGGTGSEEHMK